MQLAFDIIHAVSWGASLRSSHTFTPSGGLIGRGQDTDWYLEDETKSLSRQHAQVSFDNGRFFISDLSQNGTFHVDSSTRLPANEPFEVKSGDTFSIGEYKFRARILQSQENFQPEVGKAAAPSLLIPDDDFMHLDPLAVLEPENHRTKNELLDITEAKPEPVTAFTGESQDTLAERIQMPNLISEPIQQEVTEIPRFDEVAQPSVNQLVKSESTNTSAELDAFCKHLGIDLNGYDEHRRVEIMAMLGQTLRIAIGGMQQSLRTRSEVKNELRMNMTTLQSEGNNPLKFSSDINQTLSLILENRAGYLSAMQAFKQGFRDLQAHQVAELAATRAALDSLLQQLSPEQLIYRFEQESLLPRWRNKKASYWRKYIKLHQALNKDEDWRSNLISRDYARAYEEQVQLLNVAYQDLDI